MLTSLSLRNFKSWREIPDMRLAPITGLFGTNSSGKTSILQLLLLMKQTADSPDRAQVLNLGDDRSLVSLGTFHEVLFQHAAKEPLEWTLSWELPRELRIANPETPRATLFAGKELGFRAAVAENGSGRMVVDRMSYLFTGHEFGLARDAKSEGRYKLSALPGDFRFKRTQGRPWEIPAPVKCYGFPDQVRAYYQNAGFVADLELAFEQFFAGVYYLGPLREYPRRQYIWAGSQPADMGQRGERVVDALLAARERGMRISRGRGKARFTVEEYVAWWLAELGLIHSFSVEAITEGGNLYQVWVQKTPEAARVLITDVGFGVSQILPVLALCYYAPEGSTLILEQPEIHLHPAVQAGLADVFVDAIRTRKVQILLESHSEHLLRRLQRRIAEEGLSADDAALYFCYLENGESRARALDIDLFGNITNWPDGFFGDEFGEMAAMSEAIIRRKKQQAA
jgi:predicted ATPase